jgi:LDH2 family malate/lactate/ureidoglycolate dehydrogenase
MSAADYERRMDTMIRTVHEALPAEGFSEVLFPGEVEARHSLERTAHGIPYSRGEVATLQAEAAAVGGVPLIVSENRF